MSLETEIKEFAERIGLDAIGITNAKSFLETKKFLAKMKEKEYLSKFVPNDLELITNPRRILPTAKSIIVCALSYHVEINEPENYEKELRGKISRFAQGQDYHRVLGDKLEKLINFLQSRVAEVETRKFVDTGPTVDRALARRAGIGWQGKNCSIINPEYGSWIFIGGIITNLELKVDSPLKEQCGECRKCIEACPMEALVDNYTLNSSRCLGYITLSKGYIEEEDRKKMGTRLWGCDTCQEVCPHNQSAKVGGHTEFSPKNIEAYPKLSDLLQLTDEKYEKKFKPTAMNWRGKRPIQRNAAIIMGNLGNSRATFHLIKGLKDAKPIVRAHSAWALGEIEDRRVLNELESVLIKEEDRKVIKEIKKAQQKIK